MLALKGLKNAANIAENYYSLLCICDAHTFHKVQHIHLC